MTVIRHNSISGIVSITAAPGSNLAFYDSTGSTLSLDTGDINAGVITATTANFTNATISGDLTVNGTTTTLDTTVTEVDRLEVGANNSTVGVAITQSGSGDILRLYDGATEVFSVIDGGNVGIGTDNPVALLQVAGTDSTNTNLTIASSTSGDGGVYFYDGSNSGAITYSHSAERMIFRVGGNEKFRISDAGNIVGGTTDNTVMGIDTTPDIRVGWMKKSGLYAGIAAANNAPISFYHSDDSNIADPLNQTFTERLRIDSTGNVGIDQSSPRSKLDVFETVTGNQTAIRIGNTNTPTSANDKRLEFVDGTGTSEGTNKFTYGYVQGYREGGSNSGALIFGTKPDNASAPSERLRITSGGNVQIANGNLVFSTSGTGIDFSANSNAAGMTSELLDDYEEGTWTPSGEFAVNGTRTNVDNRGSYTKVGDVVTINFYTQVTKGTASGQYEIYGLPFTASSKTYSMAIPLGFGNMNVTNPLFGVLTSGSSRLIIFQADANPTTNVEASDLNTTNAVVNGTFVYYAS